MESTTGSVSLSPTAQALSARFSSSYDIAFAALTCLLSLVNNSLTIVTVLKTKKGIGRRAKLFITSLSACDMMLVPALGTDLLLSLFGCLHKPIFNIRGTEAIERCTRWGRALSGMMYASSFGVSLGTVFLVAADRALAVSKPLFYRNNVTDFKVKLVIAFSWCYPCVPALVSFVYFGQQNSAELILSSFHPCDILPTTFYDYSLSINFYLLTSGIIIAYTIAYYQFRKASKTIKGNEKERMDRDKRFLTMVLATVASLVVLWAPYQVTYNKFPINQPETPEFVRNTLQPTVYAISNCNGWLNPVFYFVLNKDFRRAYITLLSRNSVQPNGESSSS